MTKALAAVVVYFRPPFIDMQSVASVGRSFPSPSDSGEPLTCFLMMWIGLSLVYLFDVLFYSPSHPLSREGKRSHCSGFLSCLVWRGEFPLGRKFFNRSPITLKFGGRKIERESQERESESEIESESESELSFYACKLLFYPRKLAFYTRKLSFYTRKL